MENIQFENDSIGSKNTYPGTQKKSWMVGILKRLGVRDERIANYILLGVAGIFFVITVYLYVGMFSQPSVDQETLDREAALMQINEARQQ